MIPTDVVPVFQAVLPNGKVLMWDSIGDSATESQTVQTFTRAAVWDPILDTFHQVNVSGYNIFCAGFTQLPAVGARRRREQEPGPGRHRPDPPLRLAHGDLDERPDMAAARWYPAVTAVGNGEALILGGGPATAEVYQTNGAIRRLTGFSGSAQRKYPFLVPRPDGKVELVGPTQADGHHVHRRNRGA